MIIDAHVHLGKQYPYFGNINREYSPELLIALMDNAKVNKAIIISYDLNDLKSPIANRERIIMSKEYYVESFKKFPDRLIWFTYGYNPEDVNYLEVVKKDFSEGATGVKLFPSIGKFSLEDPKLEPLFLYCQNNSIPIMLASEFWNDISRPPYTDDYGKYKEIMANLIGKYDKINWLLCHLSSFNWKKDLSSNLADPKDIFKNVDYFIDLMSFSNVWTDISYIACFYDEPYPYPTALRLIKHLVDKIGIEKFIFGTDWPWIERLCTYKQLVDMIRFADFLTTDQKNKFLGQNAEKYLRIK
jgi:predicted TIM-barrel fold metal-dependent hydrolase